MSKLKRTMRLGLLLGGAGCHPADFRQLTRCATVSEEARLDFILLGEQGQMKLEPLTLAAA
jgi:hypothetical protein